MKQIFTLIALLLIFQCSMGQTSPSLVSAENATENPHQKIRFAVQGGYGYRLAPLADDTPPALQEYSNNLKSGFSLALDAAYFLKPTWGLGLKYSRFGSEESMGNMQVTYPDGGSVQGTISDEISIHFIGPSYISEYAFRNPKHSMYGAISLGYLSYLDRAGMAQQVLEVKGATFGAALDLGYDYTVSKNITLGAQASLTGGSLNKFQVKDGIHERTVTLEEGSQENLSRLDLTAGVKFKI